MPVTRGSERAFIISASSRVIPLGRERETGILIVDDHAAVRAGLRNLISSRPGWLVCGEASDGKQAIDLALQLKPSVVVMDISMPGINGLEATRRIRQQAPNIEIVIVSQHDSDQVVLEAQRSGARGFVVKSHLSADLLPALEAALLHSSRVSSPVSRAWHKATKEPAGSKAPSLVDPGPHDDLDLMAGGGEMGALMRSYDWSTTPFGPVSEWPQSLRTALRICLDSRFPILIWWGPELRLLYNDAWRPTLGTRKHPQALGAPAKQVWSEIWDTIGPSAESVMRTGQAIWENDQLLLINRNGYIEESYWTYSYSAIRLPSGEIGGLFSAVHEVTDRVLIARRLKTLREVADQVIQAKNETEACTLAMQSIIRNPADCPFAMIFLCQDQKASRVDSSFEARSLVPSVLDLVQDDSWSIREAVRSRSAQIFSVKEPELFPGAPYGDKCRQAISIPILGASRDAIAVLTVGISPYRELDSLYREFLEALAKNLAANINNARAYDEERKRAEALAELDRAKTIFFSNISHEFRTPLTLMLAPLEDTLAKGSELTPDQRERLEVAHRNSLRLLKLVNTLLDFSRIEAGRIDASYEPVDLGSLTTDLASVFRSAIERAGLRFVIDCPHLSESAYVDRGMWEKIVFNLLSNAFKFTFAGEITVHLWKTETGVELSVCDTGTGIPAEELPHLLERFYRVKGAHGRTFEGSGIGLALVQELVKLHGGTVRVESEENRGSRFVVTIPLGKDHLPADRIGAPRALASTSLSGEAYVQQAMGWLPGAAPASRDFQVPLVSELGSTLPSLHKAEKRSRILLADDNADMRNYVQQLLSEQYEVVVVSDGEEALSSARQTPPDLILSDIMMPGLDGYAVLAAVRSDQALKGIPVILLSARAGEEARIEGLQSGADDYLIKPFSARELMARVQSHLALSRVREEANALEHKLRRDAELLASIVASSDDAIISKNLDGTITSWNKGAEQIFGYTAQEAVGRNICLIIPPERQGEETEILSRLRRGERIDHFHTVRIRKDGMPLDISLTISPLRDCSGQIVGASKVARDITKQKRADEREKKITAEAAAANAKFRAIFEQTTVFAGIMTNDGVLLEANRLSLDACGYRAEVELGRPFWETGWWRNSSQSRDKIRAATPLVAKGVPYRETLSYSWADGTERLVDFALYPIVDQAGRTLFLHPTGIDVTDLKRTEEKYRKLAETLEVEIQARTQELVERNAEVLKHSEQARALSRRLLKTEDEERRHIARELHDSAGQTLAALNINLALLLEDARENSPDVSKHASAIQELVQQLNQEIRTTSYLLHPPLLDEAGISAALQWYIDGLRDRSGLQITLDVPERFERPSPEIELVVFRVVQECLTNIHRHSGSRTASIRLSRDFDSILLEVKDSGKGMSPEKLSEIQSRGSGVGIRGMRERVRQFHGDLKINSDEAGTKIRVKIPAPKIVAAESNPISPMQTAV